MTRITIDQALQHAMKLHQAGRLQEAEAIYQQILAQQPKHPDAIHLLGVIAHQVGRNDTAAVLIRQALVLKPNWPEAYNNLGTVLADTGQSDEAIAAYRHAIALNPYYAEAYNNLGIALKNNGQLDEAIDAYRRDIALRPDFAEGYNNLGNALKDKKQFDEAISTYQRAIRINPNLSQIHSNLGNALKDIGKFTEAIASYHRAIALNPNLPEAYNNLGNVLKDMRRLNEAEAAHRQAIALKPNYAQAHYNLGNTLKEQRRFDESVTVYRQAIALNPSLYEIHNNLGNALRERGQPEEAIAAYRRAVALKPNYADAHSNLVFALHYHATDGQAIAQETLCWNRQHAEPLRKFIQPHSNDPSPDRRLKLGYISPDFLQHPVGQFLLPLLEQHNHQQFEIFCYSDVARPDRITRRLQSYADHWLEIGRWNDQQTADQIRADRIDILIDLAGHTANNRLLVFARKPAPVQVSYLGYPDTTGMSAVDYRLTDAIADPPGSTESLHTETLYRLPQTNWCFVEPEPFPPVEPPPSIRQGYVTFGSFNNFAKVTEPMMETWARILLEVPGSRLFLKSPGMQSASVCERARGVFVSQGIDPSRLDFRGQQVDYASHLALYSEMDISLDTFPYHGTTTTCDALWMGVPVITLAGQRHVSRVSLSLLSNIGLPELAATTTEEYIGLAVALANDPDRLKTLRLSLRQRMRTSPLMDAPKFARDIEAAYRQMWQAWCANPKSS